MSFLIHFKKSLQDLYCKKIVWKIKITVACGENYTVAITKDGKVYSCGNNDYGQLGHEKARKRLRKYSKIFRIKYTI